MPGLDLRGAAAQISATKEQERELTRLLFLADNFVSISLAVAADPLGPGWGFESMDVVCCVPDDHVLRSATDIAAQQLTGHKAIVASQELVLPFDVMSRNRFMTSLRHPIAERRSRLDFINNARQILLLAGIELSSYDEIWVGPSPWRLALRSLVSPSQVVQIDHGLSDPLSRMRKPKTGIHKISRRFRRSLESHTLGATFADPPEKRVLPLDAAAGACDAKVSRVRDFFSTLGAQLSVKKSISNTPSRDLKILVLSPLLLPESGGDLIRKFALRCWSEIRGVEMCQVIQITVKAHPITARRNLADCSERLAQELVLTRPTETQVSTVIGEVGIPAEVIMALSGDILLSPASTSIWNTAVWLPDKRSIEVESVDLEDEQARRIAASARWTDTCELGQPKQEELVLAQSELPYYRMVGRALREMEGHSLPPKANTASD